MTRWQSTGLCISGSPGRDYHSPAIWILLDSVQNISHLIVVLRFPVYRKFPPKIAVGTWYKSFIISPVIPEFTTVFF